MFGFTTTDSEGVEMVYTRPLMQTLLMFVAMSLALPIYYAYLYFFHDPEAVLRAGGEPMFEKHPRNKYPKIKKKMWFILAAPACTDMLGTMSMMIGLLYVSVSVYQLVRCLVIVYVALLRRFYLSRDVYGYQWLGVFINAMSVAIVGISALFDPSQTNVILGMLWINFGCFVMACQLTLEEFVMDSANDDEDDDDDSDPTQPLIVVGMEGFWGTVILLTVVYPICYALPGDDHGSYENFYESCVGLWNNDDLWNCAMIYVVAITTYNVSAIFITKLLEAVWRSILENFRPIAVWGTDLAIFYLITNGAFGEHWNGGSSYLQVFGLLLLFYGTATYNGSEFTRLPCLKYPALPKGEKMNDVATFDGKSPARFTPGGTRRMPPPRDQIELGEYGAIRTSDHRPQAYGSGRGRAPST